MDVSVVVLNFRTVQQTAAAMRWAEQSCEGLGCELIVVDNGSADGSVELLRESCPGSRIVELRENRGFAAGMNAGIRESRGEYVLLLNSDVHPTADSVAAMLRFMRDNSGVGLCAPLLFNTDGSVSRTLLTQPTVARVLIPLVGKVVYGSWRRKLGVEPLDVEATEGAAVMASRQALETAGLMDEEFFFYHEIVEWCLRIRDRGLRICVVPEATMVHVCGGSTDGVRKAARIEMKRSEYQLLRKRLGGTFTAIVMARDFVGEVLNVAFHGLLTIMTVGRFRRSRKKLAVHWGVLWWICMGMPHRRAKSYIRHFGSWD